MAEIIAITVNGVTMDFPEVRQFHDQPPHTYSRVTTEDEVRLGLYTQINVTRSRVTPYFRLNPLGDDPQIESGRILVRVDQTGYAPLANITFMDMGPSHPTNYTDEELFLGVLDGNWMQQAAFGPGDSFVNMTQNFIDLVVAAIAAQPGNKFLTIGMLETVFGYGGDTPEPGDYDNINDAIFLNRAYGITLEFTMKSEAVAPRTGVSGSVSGQVSGKIEG